jgi:hypothetical protein
VLVGRVGLGFASRWVHWGMRDRIRGSFRGIRFVSSSSPSSDDDVIGYEAYIDSGLGIAMGFVYRDLHCWDPFLARFF